VTDLSPQDQLALRIGRDALQLAAVAQEVLLLRQRNAELEAELARGESERADRQTS